MHNHIALAISFLVTFFCLTIHTSAQSPPQYLNLALQISPDGDTIAVGTINGEVNLYDVVSKNILHTFQRESDVIDLRWSPNGASIAAISFDGQLSVWNTLSYVLRLSIDVPLEMVYRVNWSPNGSQLAITSAETGTIVLNAATGDELFHLWTGDTADSFWAPSPYLLTADIVGLRIWDGETELSRILGVVNSVINGNLPSRIAFSSAANSIALYGITAPIVDSSGSVSDVGKVLQVYDFPSLELRRSIDLSLPEQTSVMKLTWSGNGESIAISTTDGYVRIWNAATLSLVDELFIDQGVWAFDWLTDTEIVYVSNESELNVVQMKASLGE